MSIYDDIPMRRDPIAEFRERIEAEIQAAAELDEGDHVDAS